MNATLLTQVVVWTGAVLTGVTLLPMFEGSIQRILARSFTFMGVSMGAVVYDGLTLMCCVAMLIYTVAIYGASLEYLRKKRDV